MDVMELKATLYRANPAVIRQFTMPCSATTAQLGKALRLLLGWGASGPWCVWNHEREFTKETLLEETFRTGDILYWSPNMRKKTESSLIFRITLLDRREQLTEYPELVRFRGVNPPEEIEDIAAFNKLQNLWFSQNFLYYTPEYNKYKQTDYEFLPQAAKRLLKRAFAGNAGQDQAGIFVRLDYRNTCKIYDVLVIETIQELKKTASRVGVHIPSNMRKGEYLHKLIEGLSRTETLDRIIQNLSLGQYHEFQAMCTGTAGWKDTKTFGSAYNAFADCGYMGVDRYYDFAGYDRENCSVVCTRELLQTYEDWLDEGKEEKYLKRAELITSIRGCIWLYGFIERGEWKKLAVKWMGTAWTDKELETVWQSYLHYLEKSGDELIGRFRSEALYDQHSMDEKNFRALFSARDVLPRYLPSFEELKKIEEEGLLYEGQAKKELEDFLEKKCRARKVDVTLIHSEIYQFLHRGVELEECAAIFRKAAHMRDKNLLRELKGILSRLDMVTRKIDKGGYTETELAAAGKRNSGTVRRDEKKIYPNAPCPCGSGKKYKHCCGKQER